MNCKVDYKLYTGNKIEMERKNIDALFYPYKSIEFEENRIDIENHLYYRKTKDYAFVIDFTTKICKLKYDDSHIFKFQIEALIKIKEDIITLQYAFDDEIKKLDIYLKEVIL